MGPDHGPGFIQEYTNSIRKFKINHNGNTLAVTHLPAIVDPINLHRRDYNVVPQIMPDGQEGLTAFSGVFQVNADLPYLNCVNIDSSGHTVNNDFYQYFNHYHCAHIPLYSAEKNEMHTVFFGGIAQYYEKFGLLIKDDNVPFVNTIARVTRDKNGTMAEYKLPVEMPALLGAGSEFIPVVSLPQYNNEVFRLDDFSSDTTMVGYIYGGISSTEANVFFSNTGDQSDASSQIFKVYVIKNETVGVQDLDSQRTGTMQLEVYPNPNDGNFNLKFYLKMNTDVNIIIRDTSGKLIENKLLRNLQTGVNTYSKSLKELIKGGIYFITIDAGYEKATQKIIVEL
jgi:hypothetical protein